MVVRKIILVLLCAAPLGLRAQYFDQGVAPASVRWDQMQTPHERIIFPRDYRRQAIRVMHYLDTLRPYIGYGYRHGRMDMPVVLQTRNMASNGLVMRAPTRMELIVPPPAAMAPEPWLKQLTAHESRHAVQYNQVNRNVVRVAGWVLGDQGYMLGIALFPIWAMEGDAVMAETELSTFGRGLQPSFTIDYRAMLRENDRWPHWAVDKWFCGSYRHHMPDHYRLGYQISSYAWTRYGENPWDKVANYATRWPFLVFTTKISLWKYYRTSINRLCRETMRDLDAFWDSQPRLENSSEVIPTPVTSFTTYSSPLVADGRVLAFKKDLDRTERIVSVDPATGAERTVIHTGFPNSPLAWNGGRLFWSELRQSKIWTQKVNSQLCWADPATGRKGIVKGVRQALFPTIYSGKVTYVQYEYDGSYSLRVLGRGEPLWRFPLPVSVHGLAADGDALYFIAVDEGGMYIGAWTDGGIRIVKPATYATLNDLRAEEGVLYFTSTYSGRDEAHAMLAASGEEIHATQSEYGSFAPAPMPGGTVMATYTKDGYLLARQPDGVPAGFEGDPKMPLNVVNPPRVHWDKRINMDSIVVADTTSLPVKRYRKVPHMVNFHSWAPASFDPDNLVDEARPAVHAGVTAISQDLLNSTFLTLRYQYTSEGSMGAADLTYYGLAPKFELGTRVGPGERLFYNLPEGAEKPSYKPYFQLDGRVFLPLYLGSGAYTRILQPSVELDYYNALLYERDGTVSHGLHKMLGELQYINTARLAHRDFLPRLGFNVHATVAAEPFNRRFGTVWTGYARGYLPGVAVHHSTMLRAAYQWQSGGMYHFKVKELYPTGADYDKVTPQRYMAFALDYQLPVAYPEIGIPSIVYVKRIRLNAAFNYARFRQFTAGGTIGPWQEVWSYGCDITVDTNMLRAPASATNYVKFSIYRPSDRKGVFFSADMSIPL